ncbi:hypothetical protein pipiens_000567, partial [Culex pipiens pipiens]
MEKKQVHNLSGTSYLSRFSASPRTSSNRQGTSSPNSVLVPPLKPCDSSESSPGSNKKRSQQVASGTPSSSNSVSVPPQKSRNSPEPSAGNNKKRSPQAATTIKPNHQDTSSSLNSVLVPPLKPRDSPESSPGSYKKRSPQAASAIVSGSEPAAERGKEKSRSITARLVSRIPIRKSSVSSPNSVLVPPLKPCDSSESSPGSNKKRSQQVASAIVQNRQGTPSSSNSVSVPPQKSRNSPEPSAGNNKKRSPQAATTIKPNHQDTSSSLNSVSVPPLKLRDSPESSPGSNKKRSPQAASAIVQNRQGTPSSSNSVSVSPQKSRNSPEPSAGSNKKGLSQAASAIVSGSEPAAERGKEKSRSITARFVSRKSSADDVGSPETAQDQQVHDLSSTSYSSRFSASPRTSSNRQGTPSSPNSVLVSPRNSRDFSESSPGSNKKRSPRAATTIEKNCQGTPSSSNSVSVPPQKSRNSPESSPGSFKKRSPQAASAIVSGSEPAAERGKEKSRSITARLVSRIPIRKSSVDDVGSPETAQDQQVHNLFSISYSSRFSASPRTSSNRQGTPSSPNSVLISPRNSRDFSESSPGSNKKRSPRAAITIEPNRQDTSSSLNSVSVPPLKLRDSPESSPGSNKKRSPQAASAIVQNRQGTPSSSNSVSVSPQKSRNSPEPSAGSNKKGLSQAASAIVSGSEPAAERGKEKSRSITARFVSRKSSADDVGSPETAQDQQVHDLSSTSYSSRFSASPRTSSNRQGTPSSPNSVLVSPRNSRDFSESSPGSNKKRSPRAATTIEKNCQGTPSSSNSVSVPPQKSRNSPESSPGSNKKRSPQAASAIVQNRQGTPSSSNSVSVPPQKSRNSPEPSAGSNKKGLSQAASAIVSGSEPAAERGKEKSRSITARFVSRKSSADDVGSPETAQDQQVHDLSSTSYSSRISASPRTSSNRQGTPSSPNSVLVSPRNSHDSPESSPGSNKKRSRQAASVSVGQVDPDQREHRATPACDPRDPLLPVPTDRLERNALILKGPFQPTLDKYPVKSCGKSKRSFIKEWFKTYSWLEYSIEKDSCFCFFCRIFPHENSGKSGHSDAAFTQKGFDNWKRGIEAFRKHQNSRFHLNARESYNVYLRQKGVDECLDKQQSMALKKKEDLRQKNRAIISRLIDVVKVLSKGGKPFRGHSEREDSQEKGLFLELVNLLAKYDPLLKNHIETGPKNALYLSNKIQNDLISAQHNVIFRKLKVKLRGKQITLIADETSDVGHHEQLSVVVRYEDNGVPVETFVGVYRITKTDAETIFTKICEVVETITTNSCFERHFELVAGDLNESESGDNWVDNFLPCQSSVESNVTIRG